ncbi:MAG: hypothetical protein M5R40_03555 [Anaerolineae bacterium]|nr:hypothetical protein [Anaerolineae bacterium]
MRGDRFILRYPSPPETVGGGVVIDPAPGRRWRRFRPDVVARLETLTRGSPGQRVRQALDAAGTPLDPAELGRRAGLSGEELRAAIDEAQAAEGVFALGAALVSAGAWASLTERLRRELATFHAQEPLLPGMPREALRSRLGLAARPFNDLMARAAAEGVFVDEGATARLPDHAVRFSAAQAAAIDRLMGQFDANRYTPPSYKEAAGGGGRGRAARAHRPGAAEAGAAGRAPDAGHI